MHGCCRCCWRKTQQAPNFGEFHFKERKETVNLTGGTRSRFVQGLAESEGESRTFGERYKTCVGTPDSWQLDISLYKSIYIHMLPWWSQVWFRSEHALVQQWLTRDWLLLLPSTNRHVEDSPSPGVVCPPGIRKVKPSSYGREISFVIAKLLRNCKGASACRRVSRLVLRNLRN